MQNKDGGTFISLQGVEEQLPINKAYKQNLASQIFKYGYVAVTSKIDEWVWLLPYIRP